MWEVILDKNNRSGLIVALWLANRATASDLAEVEKKFGTYGMEQFEKLMSEYIFCNEDKRGRVVPSETIQVFPRMEKDNV